MAAHRTCVRMNLDFAYSPRVQTLSEIDQRRYVMIFCLRSAWGAIGNDDTNIEFFLRISHEEWLVTKDNLIAKNLIDKDNNLVEWEIFEQENPLSEELRLRTFAHKNAQEFAQICAEKTCANAGDDSGLCANSETTPYKDIIINNNTLKKKKLAQIDAQIDAQFEIFWNLYPNKKDKARARILFHKLCSKDKTLAETILNGLQKQKSFLESREVKYRPHPSTWLNRQRWEDEVTENEDPIF